MRKTFKAIALLTALTLVIGTSGCSSKPAATEATPEPAQEVLVAKTYSLADVLKTELRDSSVKIGESSVAPVALDGRKLKVGYSQMEVNNTWRIVNNDSITSEAEKRGVELVYRDAQSSIEKQNRDVIEILNEGVDYLVIAPYEFEGLAPALAEAKKRNIPVILSDRLAAGVPSQDYVTGVLGDFIDVGYKAGQSLREAFGDETIKVVEITGTAGSSVARDLSLGFKQFMEEDGNFEYIASADGNFGRADSLKAMENIIQSYNGQFNAVFCHVDDAAIASIQALKAAGLKPGQDPATDILIISMCGYKDAFNAILAGDLYGSVECTARFGPVLFDIIDSLQAGNKVPDRLVMPCKVYTKANAEALIDEAL